MYSAKPFLRSDFLTVTLGDEGEGGWKTSREGGRGIGVDRGRYGEIQGDVGRCGEM